MQRSTNATQLEPFPPLAPPSMATGFSRSLPHGQIPSVMVVGGSARDVIASPKDNAVLIPRTSNPGVVIRRWGGAKYSL